MIKFFHLEDTPMAQRVEAQAKVAVGKSDMWACRSRAPETNPGALVMPPWPSEHDAAISGREEGAPEALLESAHHTGAEW